MLYNYLFIISGLSLTSYYIYKLNIKIKDNDKKIIEFKNSIFNELTKLKDNINDINSYNDDKIVKIRNHYDAKIKELENDLDINLI